MSQPNDDVGIVPLTLDADLFAEATTILARAFQHDPFIRSLFPDDTESQSHLFFRYLLQKSDLLDERLFGIYQDGVLRGVANVEAPFPQKRFRKTLAFGMASVQLLFKLSLRRFLYLNNYMKETLLMRPRAKHHYLVFIGIDPLAQGQGFGGRLLTHIHEWVAADPNSAGIGLDTENPNNVALYEHVGYELLASKGLESITIFSLFKANEAKEG